MTRILATLSTLILLVAAPAWAEEMQGKVKVADNAGDSLTLDDGTIFYLGEEASLKGIKAGMTVVVTYELQADVKIAKKIAEKK